MATLRMVKMLVKKHGEKEAVNIIKNDHKRFPNIQNYPAGVRVLLSSSEVDSVLVGSSK